MPARIDIFNQAIAELPAKAIQSADENSLEANECRRFYPQIISEMLEGPHDWSFQNRRVALAAVSNARSSEWIYSYAVPSDMGAAIRVIPDLSALGLGYPVPLPGEPYAEEWALSVRYFETPYIIENGVIFTNVQNATLEYGINDITEAALTAMTVRAVVLDLASRIAVPVKKDRKIKAELVGMAEVAWARAIAEDMNRQPQTYDDYVSEAMLARRGALGAGC
jgi:hypothetical protein